MPRLDYRKASPEGLTAFGRTEAHVRHSGLESALLQAVRTRVSQINGCAYCLDMHSKDARAEGETEQRLYTLSAWRETPFFSERVEAARCFDDKELADLMLAIIAINGWNRLAITFQGTVGGYRSPTPAASSGDSRRT